MTRNFKYSTILAGVMGLSTLIMFHQRAQALDLSDFSGADQKVITQDAPKAGGIVLVKQDIVYPTQPSRVTTTIAQPMRTGTMLTGATASSYNNITPAAGGTAAPAAYRSGDGSTGVPGKGLDGKADITTMPGNAFDQAQAKFNGALPSAPVDGKPLTTTTAANGARINELNDVAPAAGMPMPMPTTPRRQTQSIAVDSGQSVQSMTKHKSTYNN